MDIQLSKRLQLIATLLRQGSYFLDIGSDHAYLPCYVCIQDPEARAIAGEVVTGPFERAKQTVRNYQLQDRIDVRLGSGFEVLKDDSIDEVVIAGMGGSLISSILKDGKAYLPKVERLILQPNNHEERVRRTLRELNFALTEEYIIEEKDIFYEVLVAEREGLKNSPSPYDDDKLEKQLFFGPYLLEEGSAIFRKKWAEEKEKLEKTLEKMKHSQSDIGEKIASFEKRLRWIEEVLS